MDPGGGLEGKTKLDGSRSHEHNEKAEGRRGEGGCSSTNNVPSVHLTSSPAGHNNGVSKALHVYTLLDFSLAGFSVLDQHKVQTIERFFLCSIGSQLV